MDLGLAGDIRVQLWRQAELPAQLTVPFLRRAERSVCPRELRIYRERVEVPQYEPRAAEGARQDPFEIE